jgi:hypothetical protein
MFALTEDDLDRRILGCSDGPASFNAEATSRGHHVVSCDPIYRFGRAEIQERIATAYDQVLAQARLNPDEFVWRGRIRNVEELGQVRMAAMQTFLHDFETGRRGGRYVDAELPTLPFANAEFELALCSYFLFLYSTQLGEVFHHAALHELCRVAREVRIFPLLALGGERSPFVDTCAATLRNAGYRVTIEKVPYEFQRGGDEMMRICSEESRVPQLEENQRER